MKERPIERQGSVIVSRRPRGLRLDTGSNPFWRRSVTSLMQDASGQIASADHHDRPKIAVETAFAFDMLEQESRSRFVKRLYLYGVPAAVGLGAICTGSVIGAPILLLALSLGLPRIGTELGRVVSLTDAKERYTREAEHEESHDYITNMYQRRDRDEILRRIAELEERKRLLLAK